MLRPHRVWQSSNVPKEFKKPKGRLEKIDFGEHAQQVERIWSGKPSEELLQKWQQQGVDIDKAKKYYNPGSEKSRYGKLQRLLGYGNNKIGYCSMCKNLNTHILKQKVAGAVIITRYCQEHVPDKI